MFTFDDNEMNEEAVAGDSYWMIANRRKWSLILPFVIVFTVITAVGFRLPKIYKANTLIMVEAQKVPQEYVKPVITSNTQEWLTTIREQILSRSLLKKVAEEFSLDHVAFEGFPDRFRRLADKVSAKLGYNLGLTNPGSQGEIIDVMQDNIEIETVGGPRSVVAFSISFKGSDPETVMNVTNRLTSLFIEKNLESREQLVEGTSLFLEAELERLRRNLEAQEEKITNFKRLFNGVLPSQLDANLRALDRFQLQMEATQEDIKELETRKAFVEKEYLSFRSGDPRTSQADLLSAQLLERKRALATLQSEYKDTYPDIINMKQEIAEIEAQLAKESALQNKPSSPPLERVNQEGKILLQELESRLRRLRVNKQNLLLKIKEFENRVEEIPLRDQELKILVRDYENTKINYSSLLSKRLDAKISENLERRQKGEMFRVIDLAELPEKPFSPNLAKIAMLGLAAGMASGVGLVTIREQVDTSYHTADDLGRSTGYVVLAAIPNHRQKIKVADYSRGYSGKGRSLTG